MPGSAFVTDSNCPQPLWQPPPTACLTASGAASGPFPSNAAPPPAPSAVQVGWIAPSFEVMGVITELQEGLRGMGITTPSPIQQMVIPRLMRGESLAYAATTGSGKTLAYLLPVIQELKAQELAGVERLVWPRPPFLSAWGPGARAQGGGGTFGQFLEILGKFFEFF